MSELTLVRFPLSSFQLPVSSSQNVQSHSRLETGNWPLSLAGQEGSAPSSPVYCIPLQIGRTGGNRTPNPRFWRPVLCQLSYCPLFIGGGPFPPPPPLLCDLSFPALLTP